MTTLANHLTLGSPQLAGPLAVFPLFGPEPRLTYRSFAQATALGALVKELDEGASVNDLTLANPTDLPLLVYEGEEVLGAQQNRTFDVSVLLDTRRHGAGAGQLCRGRSLGRLTPRRGVRAVAAGGRSVAARSQARVANSPTLRRGWTRGPTSRTCGRTSSDKLAVHGVDSESAAMSDLYDRRRARSGRDLRHDRL